MISVTQILNHLCVLDLNPCLSYSKFHEGVFCKCIITYGNMKFESDYYMDEYSALREVYEHMRLVFPLDDKE